MTSIEIPILLLKTRSTPNDSYEDYLSKLNPAFIPTFIPVLEHRPKPQTLDHVRRLLQEHKFGTAEDAEYGGMILTSQRAVEALANVVEEIRREMIEIESANDSALKHMESSPEAASPPIFPLYTVGPATSRTLQMLCSAGSTFTRLLSPYQPTVLGAETGNGEKLAHYILMHYNGLLRNQVTPETLLPQSRPPLLFLASEQRRDIIPRTLRSETVDLERRIRVDELAVYETSVKNSFLSDFVARRDAGRDNAKAAVIVVVVFSPSGCEAMLSALDLLDHDTGKANSRARRRWQPGVKGGSLATEKGKLWVIATIGPTTREYLSREFVFQADICADTPSPEGVGEGVVSFLKGKGILNASD